MALSQGTMPRHGRTVTTVLLLAGMGIGVSACGDGSRMLDPVGIGSERDQLKRSPCACVEIPQPFTGWRMT